MNEVQFIEALNDHGIELTGKQQVQFATYFRLLVEWNEKINLTSLTEKEDVYLKHFYDSLTLSFYKNMSDVQSLCDVGSGAGFPSIPLKICFPHLRISIVDSLKKRINFLELLADELELDDVHFYHDRAEQFGRAKEHREKYDVVTARAVARMSVLSELCLPLVKLNGSFIAMKGSQGNDELVEGLNAIKTLGGKHLKTEDFALPIEDSERSIIFVDKVKKTPKKYPRKAGTPNRQPIQ